MTEVKKNPIVLVDGSSYLYRAYHALPPLSTSSGRPTGAVRGVISMIRRLQKDYPDGAIAVVFDARGKTFRDELFAEYKANRPSMPEDLALQVEPIHDIIRAMGLPLIIKEGVEADDVIGTLALQAAGEKRPVVISTGDKDMAQLVTGDVTLVNTMTDTVLDIDGVREKFGVPPALVIDLLALMGDKSDNIPGVPGIGEKTARALLDGIGGMDSIYADLDRIAELDIRGAKKLPEKLRNEEDSARLSYKLATIRTDVDLDFGPEDLAAGDPDEQRLVELFRELEFKGWLEELLEQAPAADSTPAVDYDTVLTAAAFEAWVQRLEQAGVFAFDTETTSLSYIDAEVVGVSFAVDAGEAAYVPVAHSYPGAPDQLDRERVLERLRPLLESAERPKIGQNLKYDMSVLANHGITLRGVRFDTMLESYVLNSTATRHDMDSLALRYLGHKTIHFDEVAGSGAKQLTFDQVGIDEAAPYAAEDADVTLRLHHRLWPDIESEAGLKRVFEEIEMPLVPVLSRMERNGALIDRAQLATQSNELGKRIGELEARAHDLAGGPFNLGSPKQLGEILFERLELPVLRKTPKGAPSTAEEVLQELALDYPLPEVILEYRGLSKLKSTYTDKLPEMINARTGRVHTSYHQAVAATGRLSSSDPNLQNIPVRTEEGRRIRQAFVAPPGCRLLAADYSQIELRIMAHLSGDGGLLNAFAEGLDIHRATAAEVFGVEPGEVTTDQRRSAKAINFGLIYGMSAFGLGRQLRVGRKQAQEYIDRYFDRYPGVLRYMDDTRRLAAEKGYVETLFGRRLYLPEIDSRNGMRRQAAERTAINAPMQGTAADIIKRAMIEIDRWLQADRPPAKMIMQVHDELVFEVADDAVDEIAARVRATMAGAAALSVPLDVDIGTGANWDEAH